MCFAYKTMFWQCSTEDKYEILFQGNFAYTITTHTVGRIRDSLSRKIIRLNIITTFS